jgi:hypothetical protein
LLGEPYAWLADLAINDRAGDRSRAYRGCVRLAASPRDSRALIHVVVASAVVASAAVAGLGFVVAWTLSAAFRPDTIYPIAQAYEQMFYSSRCRFSR